MNPLQQSTNINHAIAQLVRMWLHMKYRVNVDSIPLDISPPLNVDNIHQVLAICRNVPLIVDGNVECHINISTSSKDTLNFRSAVNFVKGNHKSATLPPLMARTKSGHWVVVVNEGGGKLQGYSQPIGDGYVFIDQTTFDKACPVFDIQITSYKRYPTWCPFNWCCGCIPRTTPFFRSSGEDILEQSELDASLLEECDYECYDNVLS
jgi:hypothetical protein